MIGSKSSSSSSSLSSLSSPLISRLRFTFISEAEDETGTELLDKPIFSLDSDENSLSSSLSSYTLTSSSLSSSSSSSSSSSPTINLLIERRKNREELERKKQEDELQRRKDMENRIKQMKHFSIPSSKEEQQLSHHRHIRHYPYLIFEPFMKSIIQAHRKRLQRRKATFVLKRFFQRVISWIKVVLAVRILTRNRLAYKRRNRLERAAIVIQCAVRRRRAILLSQKRKYSALIIYKALQHKRKEYLKRKELEDKAHFLHSIIKLQRRFRWRKNHKIHLINKQIERENNACKKIQKLFRSKWKRPVYLPEIIDTLTATNDEPDPNEFMILRKVLKPPIHLCRGYWIEIDDDLATLGNSTVSQMAGREGLIEGVDYETGIMIVDFGDKENPEEYEVDYNSEHIMNWFKMTTRKEQNNIVKAALKLQLWVRRRLKAKREAATNKLLAPELNQDVSNNSLPIEDDDLMILRAVPRPTISNCVGYWIVFPDDVEREALVENVNLKTKVITAEYHDTEDKIQVSYDANLNWFRMSSKAQEEREIRAAIRIQRMIRGKLTRLRFKTLKEENSNNNLSIESTESKNNQKQLKQDDSNIEEQQKLQPISSIPASQSQSSSLIDDTFELEAIDIPPSLENCPGHWIIRVNDPDGKEGKVDSIDLLGKLMKVIYENEETNEITSDDVPYNEPDLIWYQETHSNKISTTSLSSSTSKTSKPLFHSIQKPPIDQSIGCYIIMVEDTKDVDSYDMGLIIDVDIPKKQLKIHFINRISYDGRVVCEENIEEVPYTSGQLKWLASRS